jgi:hypothetical protein
MNTELLVDPKEFGLEETKAKTIENSFLPKIVERDGFVSVYENLLTQELTQQVCVEAGNLRKKLVKVRTGIADIHKVEKAFYLASGRYVDALKNKYTLPIEQMEEKLSEIEKYYENQEKLRIEQLSLDREASLLVYEVENVKSFNLGTMTDEVWNSFFTGIKTNYEAKKESERVAEQERLKEIRIKELHEERKSLAIPYFEFWSEFEKTLNFGDQSESDFNNFMERIKALKKESDDIKEAQRLENERLKKEAAIMEAELALERKRVAEQEAIKQAELAAQKAAADKILKEQEEKAAAERKAIQDQLDKQKAAADKLAKDEADRLTELKRIEKEKEEAAKKLAKASDSVKLKTWIDSFSIGDINTHGMTEDSISITTDIQSKFNSFKTWALSQIK